MRARLSCCLVFVLLAPAGLASGFPVVDIAANIQLILKNIQDGMRWVQEVNKWKKDYENAFRIAGMEADNENNAATNTISRLSAQMTDIASQQEKARMAPSADACTNYRTAETVNRGLVDSGNFLADSRRRFAKTHTDPVKDTGDLSIVARNNLIRINNECAELDKKLGAGACSRADFLLADTVQTLTPDQVKASDNFIEMLVGVVPDKRPSLSPDAKINPIAMKADVEYKKRVATRALVLNSLKSIQVRKVPVRGGASMYQAMNDFANEKMTGEWMAVTANAHPSKSGSSSKFSTPEQVIRSTGQIEAFRAFVNMEMLESLARQEALMALLAQKEILGE